MERDCFGEGRIVCGEKTQLGGMEDNSLRDLGGGGGWCGRTGTAGRSFAVPPRRGGVLGASVDTALWPKKPDEERLPWCPIVGCSCIS